MFDRVEHVFGWQVAQSLFFFRFRKETLLSIMGIKKLSRAGMDRVGDHGSSVT